jgi:hypothetical protein
MDSRVNILKAAFDHQTGGGFNFPVYQGRTQYGHGFDFPVFQGRSQEGAGLGDVFRGICRFFRPVTIKGAQTFLKSASEAIKDGATVKDVLSSTLKPNIGAVLGATAEQVANRFISDKPSAAPPTAIPTEQPGAPLVGTEAPQQGAGKRKPSSVYKKAKKAKIRYSLSQPERPIIYNF